MAFPFPSRWEFDGLASYPGCTVHPCGSSNGSLGVDDLPHGLEQVGQDFLSLPEVCRQKAPWAFKPNLAGDKLLKLYLPVFSGGDDDVCSLKGDKNRRRVPRIKSPQLNIGKRKPPANRQGVFHGQNTKSGGGFRLASAFCLDNSL